MAGKNDIVDHVLNQVDGLSKKQATEAVEAAFEAVANALAGGDERVQVPGFGSFQLSHRAARKGRNPQTGEPMDIAASTGVRFKAGKGLKDSVNN